MTKLFKRQSITELTQGELFDAQRRLKVWNDTENEGKPFLKTKYCVNCFERALFQGTYGRVEFEEWAAYKYQCVNCSEISNDTYSKKDIIKMIKNKKENLKWLGSETYKEYRKLQNKVYNIIE